MLIPILLLAVGFVAFTNGANANFKGVASLYGSGTTTLRRALWWGTATTFAGSLAASVIAEGMIKKFSGRGIVPDELVQSPTFVGNRSRAGLRIREIDLDTKCQFRHQWAYGRTDSTVEDRYSARNRCGDDACGQGFFLDGVRTV